MIAIIDYGMGNLGSISNMIKKAGGESVITNSKETIESANGIILPGVGSFDTAIRNLKRYDFIEYIRDIVLNKNMPILGICLGMQIMTNKSEEGNEEGLRLIDAETVKFFNNSEYKVPHMGWNFVSNIVNRENTVLYSSFVEDPRFYFLHSYYVKCNGIEEVIGKTYYGHDFISSIENKHIFAVQFHPEKSHRFGITLLKNYINYCSKR